MSSGGGTNIAETNTIASRVIFINSANATTVFNDTRSNFEFVIQEPIVVPNHHSIMLSLMSAEIPFSFYRFNDRNNTIQYEITAVATPATYNLGVAFGPGSATNPTNFILENNGNYTPQQLANNLDDPNFGVNPLEDLDLIYDEAQQKFGFKYDGSGGGPANARLTLLLRSGNLVGVSDMVEELGYTEDFVEQNGDPYFQLNAGVYTAGFTKVVGGIVVDTPIPLSARNDFYAFSPFVADFNNQIRTLFLRTNLSTNSVMDSFIGGGFSNILARVPINAQPGGTINITPKDGDIHKLLVRKKAFTSVNIRLTNHRNETIDLNGLNFDIALKLDFVENQSLIMPTNIREIVEASKQEEEELELIEEDERKKTKKKKKQTKKNK